MNDGAPVRCDIVLVGGGHAHVAVLKSFGMRPEPGVRLTLIARDIDTPYSGMLPGLMAGHYGFREAHVDLRRLARFANARFIHAEVTGLDADDRRVDCAGRPPLAYDLLSIDIGSRPPMDGVAGAAEHALPVKPVGRFLAAWDALERRIAVPERTARLAVVGAGAGGVELALSLHHRLTVHAGLPPERLEITVLTDQRRPLPGHGWAVRRLLRRALMARGIRLLTRAPVTRIEAGRIAYGDGHELACDAAILATGAAAPRWLADTGLALDERGFIEVDDCLRSTSHAEVFAAGDIAGLRRRVLPKSGVYAVRQGPVLADSLRRLATGRPPRRYRPQRRTLALISTGDRNAVASWGPLAAEGPRIWRWKDRIDRRWMRRYQDLPAMGGDEAEAENPLAMRCGGCGAKVASPVLRRALERLQPRFGENVVVGLDAPDDAAVLAPVPGMLWVQSVDQFRAFIDDPFLFGRIAANHALGDLYAMGAEPQSALALATLPFAGEARLEEELYQLLAGALHTLDAAGAALIGGHTAEGAELALGFAVNGLVSENAVLRKSGLRPGDRLILTKPLGTGAIFAADMRGAAAGVWVERALRSMLRSNGPAAAGLLAHGATACTDVTGFGLAGHLIEMLRASGVAAEITTGALPALPGAAALLAAGISSSLQPANEAFAAQVEGGDPASPHWRLLYDPQTAGGLLAGVPEVQAEACLAALHAGGDPDAAVIGVVTEPAAWPIRLTD